VTRAIFASGRAIALAIVLGWAAPAAAQTQTFSSSRPEMEVFVAPEIKITKFDNLGATLAGVSFGTIQGQKLIFGFGVHTLAAGGRSHRSLTYGGVLFGWMFGGDRPAKIIARSLVGFGRIVEKSDIPEFDYSQGLTFVVFEPEVGVSVQRTNSRARFLVLAGYRAGSRAQPWEPSATGYNVTTSVQFVF
jgi:hypothetical protein